jgi:hypothetical protein
MIFFGPASKHRLGGGTELTLLDPSGNRLIFVERTESSE